MMSGEVTDEATTSDEEQVYVIIRQTRKGVESDTINGHEY
jgi:hypothetical protein